MLVGDADDQSFFARERLGHAAFLSSRFAGHPKLETSRAARSCSSAI
jgi:hypothetical protein